MKKRLPKAQKGAAKIVKSVAKKVKPVTKAVKKPSRATNAFEREIEAAITSLERAKLKKQFSALDSKIKKKEGSLKPKKMQKGGTTKYKSISGKPPVPKEATSKRARRKTGKMLDAVTGTKSPRSKKQLARRIKKGKVGTGLILPKKQIGGTIKPPKVKGKEKRRLSQIDRRADRMIKKGADKRTVETMRDKAKMTPGSKIATKGQTKRMVKKMKKSSTKTTPVPTTMAKKQKGGLVERVKRGKKIVGPGGNLKRVRELNKQRKKIAATKKQKSRIRKRGKRIYG